MTRVLNRLRRMTRDEVSERARAMVRIAADRVAVRLRPRHWDRTDIRHVLSADIIDTALRDAIRTGRWDDVQRLLMRRMRGRETRFALDPASAALLRADVLRRWPAAAARTAERGEAILAGRYDLLGYRALRFAGRDGQVDWHLDPVHAARAPLCFWADVPYLDPAIGDHKIIWELNRHQHWLRLGTALWLTGDTRYARRMLDELHSWLAANPPLMGINWASMLELAFRSMSWVWGLHFLLGASDADAQLSDPQSSIPDPRGLWLLDMFVALDRQLTHIERNLSTYFSPNTHLTGEALALYVTGVALPELEGSRRWRDTGRRILLEEIDRQIHDDGGHVERSTHYHRYTLDFYLMALLTARLDGDDRTERRFGDATLRLAEFARAMADSAGRLPLIGDDDGGMLWPFAGRECPDVRDSLAVAAALLDRDDLAPWGLQEETCWILGAQCLPRECLVQPFDGATASSRLLSDTGYVVARDNSGNHAVFDVGQHGYMNGGHAHADALSMTLSLEGRPLLIDPGTATYTIDSRIRDRFRSSISHNTLTIDGRPQAHPSGPFHWHSRANASLHGWHSHPQIDWAEASHDGYAPVRHRRSMLRTAESGWLVIDEVLGEGLHTAAAHWHFDPHWTVRVDAPGRLRATHVDGGEAWILYDPGDIWLGRGDEASALGWHSPSYGTVVPTCSARITRTGQAPFALTTWISTTREDGPPPAMEQLLTATSTFCNSMGVSLRIAERDCLFIVRPGSSNSRHMNAREIGGVQTDARVFHSVEERGTLTRLDLIDTTHTLIPRCDISLFTAERLTDLHVSLEENVLDLRTSHPPAELVIQGSLVKRVAIVRLNHRELSPRAADRADGFSVCGGDWAGPVRDLLPSMA